MAAASLEIVGLISGYGETKVIEDLSLAVPAGQRLAVLGRNGVGKTTLLASLMGLTRRHAGTIAVGGTSLERANTARRAHAGLGYVPQTRDVFRSLTVEENLLAARKSRPREAVEEAYALFPRLKERRSNLASQMSGGEQQMLSTARAILGQPSVLLLDEPLEGLAPVICDELMDAFAGLARTGAMTILLVEQQVDRALAFAERVIVLERGRLVWDGTPEALHDDAALVERYVGVAMH